METINTSSDEDKCITCELVKQFESAGGKFLTDAQSALAIPMEILFWSCIAVVLIWSGLKASTGYADPRGYVRPFVALLIGVTILSDSGQDFIINDVFKAFKSFVVGIASIGMGVDNPSGGDSLSDIMRSAEESVFLVFNITDTISSQYAAYRLDVSLYMLLTEIPYLGMAGYFAMKLIFSIFKLIKAIVIMPLLAVFQVWEFGLEWLKTTIREILGTGIEIFILSSVFGITLTVVKQTLNVGISNAGKIEFAFDNFTFMSALFSGWIGLILLYVASSLSEKITGAGSGQAAAGMAAGASMAGARVGGKGAIAGGKLAAQGAAAGVKKVRSLWVD